MSLIMTDIIVFMLRRSGLISVSARETLKIGPARKFQSARRQFRGKFDVWMGSAWPSGKEIFCRQEPVDIQELHVV